MEENLISREIAELAKRKGINIVSDKGYFRHGTEELYDVLLLWCEGEEGEPEFGYAPSQSYLQSVLREELGLIITVQPTMSGGKVAYYFSLFKDGEVALEGAFRRDYEVALEEGLLNVLNKYL